MLKLKDFYCCDFTFFSPHSENRVAHVIIADKIHDDMKNLVITGWGDKETWSGWKLFTGYIPADVILVIRETEFC